MIIKDKKVYAPPTIEVTKIEMEQSIAAGSATISPSSSEAVEDEWDDDGDDDRGINWDMFD